MKGAHRNLLCGHGMVLRNGGLVGSTLDFQLEGQIHVWLEPGLFRCVVSLDKKLYSTLSLSTQGRVVQSRIKLTQG